jgi:cytochrome c-type biogenesis protein CcmH
MRAGALAGILAAALLAAACTGVEQAALPAFGPQTSAAEVPALIPRMQAHLERTPRDARGWVMLARMQFAIDRFADSAQAYERALAVSRKVAQDPQVWCELADALAMAQGGSLRGRPREMIDRALGLKGSHPRALEMAGSAEVEARDYRRALQYWEPLLAQLPPQSREHAELARAIERLRLRAGTLSG